MGRRSGAAWASGWRRVVAFGIGVGMVAVVVRFDFVRADDISGTWTGEVETRGNYYLERSTRVISPALRATAFAPDGTTIGGRYVVDAITSASIGSGLVSDIRFTEIRHEVTGQVSHPFAVDRRTLRLELGGRASTEPDYLSFGGTGGATWETANKQTSLHAFFSYGHDTVGQIFRGAGGGATGSTRLANRGTIGTLQTFSGEVSVAHAFSPVMTAEAGYQAAYLSGYQANPYRSVIVGGTPRPETHPDERVRHRAYARAAHYFPDSATALHGIVTGYSDSWSVRAIAPEVLVYQEFGAASLLRLRYRYYVQSRSEFWHAPEDYSADARYVTADPKLTAFTTSLLGAQWTQALTFLEHSPFAFASRGSVDVLFERFWNTNRFGNGVIAQLGYRQPF